MRLCLFVSFLALIHFASADSKKPAPAVFHGEMTALEKCKKGEFEIWISQRKTLFYQAKVPLNGTFEFSLQPGEYYFTATSSKGCLFQKKLTAKSKARELIQAKLAPANNRDPAMAMPSQQCFMCAPPMYPPVQSRQMPFGNTPWWAMYGGMNYSNFHYPGPWQNPGLIGPQLPGSGSAVAMKPNIYISGSDDKNFEVKLNYKPKSHSLIEVPQTKERVWEIQSVTDNKWNVGEANYTYLYYDYRFDDSTLQKEAGFCTDAESLMPNLLNILKRLDFTRVAQKEFKEHWSIKIPPSSSYCVYPQTKKELNRSAEIEVPERATLTRIFFMILTKEQLKTPEGNAFNTSPSTWTPSERTPSSKDSLKIQEWGVGFLAYD